MKNYYLGIYKDYSKNKIKIAQLADTVDSLNCEILANPGCVLIEGKNWRHAWRHAKEIAKLHSCNFIENNCHDYGYRLFNLNSSCFVEI